MKKSKLNKNKFVCILCRFESVLRIVSMKSVKGHLQMCWADFCFLIVRLLLNVLPKYIINYQ